MFPLDPPEYIVHCAKQMKMLKYLKIIESDLVDFLFFEHPSVTFFLKVQSHLLCT